MPQLSRSIPYIDTSITASQSKIDIEAMLKESGINDIRWTEISGQTTLEFVWKFEERGVRKTVAFKISPPNIITKGRQKQSRGYNGRIISSGPIVNKPRPDASMRLLWWWLKAKLEGVRFGLESMEQAMMSQVLVSLPNGQTTTIGAILSEAIKTDAVQALKALPGTVNMIPVSEQNYSPLVIELDENGNPEL